MFPTMRAGACLLALLTTSLVVSKPLEANEGQDVNTESEQSQECAAYCEKEAVMELQATVV